MKKQKFPEVIIFDLDDTIVDFHNGVIPSWHTACAAYCEKHNHIGKDELYREIRKSGKWFWSDPERHRTGRNDLLQARRDIVYHAFKNLGFPDKDHAYGLANHYSELRTQALTLLPGALETLQTFRDNGQRMVLLTNGESLLQREKIRMFQLEHFFEHIFVEGEVGVGKPDIKAYHNVLQKLQLPPSDFWMVGDNLEWDIYAPQSIGIYSIWNDYSGNGLPAACTQKPDRIINSITELLE
jgi:putative hydrolase of the HAD superfamily